MMNTQGRALFNLIKMNWLEDPSLPVKEWQIEDLHTDPIEKIFDRLHALNVGIDKQHFFEYAENVSSPEELAEVLDVEERDPEKFDQIYLLLFELWRRLLPERESLSIFCDKLDNLISSYNKGDFSKEEALQEALADLERLLDENVDRGIDPKQIFEEVSQYCAHDLKSFIYDYASKQFEDDPLYASEIIENFQPYVKEEKQFDFLRCQMMFETDAEEAVNMFERLLEQLEEEPDLSLLMEMAKFLVDKGVRHLFIQTIRQMRPLIKTEKDIMELLSISAEFFRLLNQNQQYKKIHAMIKNNEKKKLKTKILDQLYSLFEDLNRSEM